MLVGVVRDVRMKLTPEIADAAIVDDEISVFRYYIREETQPWRVDGAGSAARKVAIGVWWGLVCIISPRFALRRLSEEAVYLLTVNSSILIYEDTALLSHPIL
jgi:hypothetical protein